jgi:hypothetical protein
MSLIVAFAGKNEAIIGGDKRSLAFIGSCPVLEDELYSGKIKNDAELATRAKELDASLQISDGREKVWVHGDGNENGNENGSLLVGEVTEISLSFDRRRRIYLAPGAYLMAEIRDGEAKITGQGRSGCIVFGNKLTQSLAAEAISKAGGKMSEEIIKSIFADVAGKTASVSKDYAVLCSRDKAALADPNGALLAALQEDCKNSGWRLCGRQ